MYPDMSSHTIANMLWVGQLIQEAYIYIRT